MKTPHIVNKITLLTMVLWYIVIHNESHFSRFLEQCSRSQSAKSPKCSYYFYKLRCPTNKTHKYSVSGTMTIIILYCPLVYLTHLLWAHTEFSVVSVVQWAPENICNVFLLLILERRSPKFHSHTAMHSLCHKRIWDTWLSYCIQHTIHKLSHHKITIFSKTPL